MIKVAMTMSISQQTVGPLLALSEMSGILFLNTQPCGCRASAYLYHSIFFIAISYILMVARIQYISTTVILANFKFSVALLSVRGLIFIALKQPFISLATSLSILATLLAMFQSFSEA